MLKQEYPCFAAVNRAASVIPRHDGRVIWLTYTPDGPIEKTLLLVGKGVTYDTGGADIKAGGNIPHIQLYITNQGGNWGSCFLFCDTFTWYLGIYQYSFVSIFDIFQIVRYYGRNVSRQMWCSVCRWLHEMCRKFKPQRNQGYCSYGNGEKN